MITVTTKDHETADEETIELAPDSYVLVVGDRLELTHEQIYSNGTRIITLRRRESGPS